MTTIAQTLTQNQIDQAQQQAQTIANTAMNVVKDGQFVFFAAFDGTRNDRNHVEISGNPQSMLRFETSSRGRQ